MDKTTHPYFVPDSTQGSRKETAVLLVGTASEGDSEGAIPQREVAATQGGFRISERVYKALGWDEDDDNDEVGGNDARQVPGEVVTGQVPVSSPLDDEEVPTEDEADAETPTDDDAPEPAEDDEPLPYDQWDYADLKAEVAKRDLATDDLKTATLIAALTADDQADAQS